MSGSMLVSFSSPWPPGCEIVPSLSTSSGRRERSLVETESSRQLPKKTRACEGRYLRISVQAQLERGLSPLQSSGGTQRGVSLEPSALLDWRISGSLHLKQKKRSWGLSMVTVLISVRIDESADGRTHSQSGSGRFVECNRHWKVFHTIQL